MNVLKKVYRKIIYTLAQRNWKSKREFLIRKGAVIGEGTRLNCTTNAFGTEPYLIEVGRDCLFAKDVNFVTHDGGIKVLNTLGYFGEGKRMDKMGRIRVGDNVYIGMDAQVMLGCTIGNNVIIGSKALVTHDIPDNCVAVGIPARVICTLDEYYGKCLERGNVYETAGMKAEDKKVYLCDNVK